MDRYEDEVDQDEMEIIENHVLKNEKGIGQNIDDDQIGYKRQRMSYNGDDQQHLGKDNKLKQIQYDSNEQTKTIKLSAE